MAGDFYSRDQMRKRVAVDERGRRAGGVAMLVLHAAECTGMKKVILLLNRVDVVQACPPLK
jgi:hypothetical protein